MKRLLFAGLILTLCLSLCSCGSTGESSDQASDAGRSADTLENEPTVSVTEHTAQPSATSQTEESNPGVAFPFEDDEGRTRYRLVINGTEVETGNYPFTLPDEPNSGYYPIEDVLNCFGVACLTNEDKSACATVINNALIQVFADSPTLTYGSKTISAVDTKVVPVVVEGALYVPSFFLMQLSDSSIVDFSDDRSAATLETDIVVDASISGLVGVDTSMLERGGSGQVVTNGIHRCPRCGGAGGRNVAVQDKYWNQGQWIPTLKSSWEVCPYCGGSGTVN
jgi:hypothetical protein